MKKIILSACILLASISVTLAANTANNGTSGIESSVQEILEMTAGQTGLSASELNCKYEMGLVEIQNIEDGYLVRITADDGGPLDIIIADNL